jgi:hypothetical protein
MQASSSKLRAASFEQQASSLKPQALQVASSKLQASSSKHQAASLEQRAPRFYSPHKDTRVQKRGTLLVRASELRNPNKFPLVVKYIGEIRDEYQKKYDVTYGRHILQN